MKNKLILFLAAFFAAFVLADTSFASVANTPVGFPVTFTVNAQGTQPFTYQWSKNGVEIPGATEASYAIASVALSDAGTYTAVVMNKAGNAVSDNAVFSITVIPGGTSVAISSPDQSVGKPVTFTASVASGTLPVTFQWKKNGIIIPGATSQTFTIAAVATTDAGSYTVTSTNRAGSNTSPGGAFTITVNPTQAITSILTP